MDEKHQTQPWMKIVLVFSIALFALYFVSGILLTRSVGQCMLRGGVPDWEDTSRAFLLLGCLPVALYGIRRSLVASYLLFCGAALALVIAILQRQSEANLYANGFIFASMLLVGLFLYGRSAWLPQYRK